MVASVSIGTPNINSHSVAFGNGTTHTFLASTVFQFFVLTSFTAGMQVHNGIESGYYSSSQPPTFISTFIASSSGNVYANGNITCEGILTATNIDTKTDVDTHIAKPCQAWSVVIVRRCCNTERYQFYIRPP